MNRFHKSALALMLCLVSAASAAAREKVDRTRDAVADGFVKVIVVRGHLKVEGWDENKIHVSGLLDEKTRKFIFDVDKNRATIEVRLPDNLRGGWWHADGSDLVVQVPKNSRVDVSVVSADSGITDVSGGVDAGTVSGDLTVDNVGQKVRLSSVSGEVQLRQGKGRISAKSVSGNVHVYDSNGSFRLHSVSGNIVARNVVGDDFDLQSISGDIGAEKATYKEISGNSVSGDLDIAGNMQPNGSLDLDSVSGSIRVTFKEDVDARFDLDAGSGTIRNDLTGDKPVESRYTHDETLQFVKGSGKAEVSLTTRSGDIVVRGQ